MHSVTFSQQIFMKELFRRYYDGSKKSKTEFLSLKSAAK